MVPYVGGTRSIIEGELLIRKKLLKWGKNKLPRQEAEIVRSRKEAIIWLLVICGFILLIGMAIGVVAGYFVGQSGWRWCGRRGHPITQLQRRWEPPPPDVTTFG